ncbi:uncharacterized protein RSE6_14869 [Rhynchosporium secalis]|uniref:Uncharacterized protein n=2 Tax=Rhynchosporium TaxID=38037 RepID=A0A1E1MWB6_RHYSE|nr:uncharacterized protein RSE6_14869 [Rhynchosporium secalis]
MHTTTTSMPSLLNIFLLSIISIFSSSLATTVGNFDSRLNNHTAGIAAMGSISSRWEPGLPVSTSLEPRLAFNSCTPDMNRWTMCQLDYIEKSSWGHWGMVILYDNWCRRIGYNSHVDRKWLAGRWSLSSELPMYVDFKITKKWTGTMDKGVEIWYHTYHTQPFIKMTYPWWSDRLWRGRLQSIADPGQVYDAFVVPFQCHGGPNEKDKDW